jgi:murein DD-endopeptidase MepM/ murein hydrolase activator NlpD
MIERTGSFVLPPEQEARFLAWPSRNRFLFDAPEKFFARTRVNPDYGRPGWTRDCGRRFHRGCDIAPYRVHPTATTHRIMFTDCATGKEFPSDEPGWIPEDDLFAVADGDVVEVNQQPNASTLGNYMVLAHRWPDSPQLFYSLYAHMADCHIASGLRVKAGQLLGRMGQTSSSSDARNWMAIAPHVHLEFYDPQGRSYDPEQLLRRHLDPQAPPTPSS